MVRTVDGRDPEHVVDDVGISRGREAKSRALIDLSFIVAGCRFAVASRDEREPTQESRDGKKSSRTIES